MVGEIEKDDDGVLLVRRIHAAYHLLIDNDPAVRERAERAHALHADRCPMARSVCDSIAITTSLEMANT